MYILIKVCYCVTVSYFQKLVSSSKIEPDFLFLFSFLIVFRRQCSPNFPFFLQELQNEVGALLEFRDLVIETFPDLKSKMASSPGSSTITGLPSSSSLR